MRYIKAYKTYRYFLTIFSVLVISGGFISGCSKTTSVEATRTALKSQKAIHLSTSHQISNPKNYQTSNFYRLTVGTVNKSIMEVGEKVSRPDHGVRIYCPISHFSYDDPIVFPKQPGAAHFHMFIGNTDSDAHSTPESLVNSGKSTCEGGINIRSSYWVPVLFSEFGEAVVPEDMLIYYKTFGVPENNFQYLQRIPNKLQMLSSPSTKNAKPDNHRITFDTENGKQTIGIKIDFPSCIATDNNSWNGNPILDYRDMPGAKSEIINSHVSFPDDSDPNFLGCPKSHPYRTPTMQLLYSYDRAVTGKKWYLSSDMNRQTQGETLHADYIAAWDEESMDRILKCNQEARRCNFSGGREQLPERFKNPAGIDIYQYSNVLTKEFDRTPFGGSIPSNLSHRNHLK